MSIVTAEETKRGPSLSLCTLRGPGSPLWLTKNRKRRKTRGERDKKGTKENEGSHTHPHTSFLSSSVAENKERGGWGERKREDEEGKGGDKMEREGGRITVHSSWANWRGLLVPSWKAEQILLSVCAHVRFFDEQSKTKVSVCVCVCKVDSSHHVPISLKGRRTRSSVWLRVSHQWRVVSLPWAQKRL